VRVARRFNICIIVALALATGCGARSGASGLPSGWAAYYRSGALFVPHPPGWQVQERSAGEFLAYLPGDAATARALIFVQPLQFSAQRNAADALGLLPRELEALFPRARIVGGAALDPPFVGVRGELQFEVQGRPYRGAALVLQTGPVGALYVMSATAESWDAQAQTMAAILSGFRYLTNAGVNAAAPARVSNLQWTLWRDPREGAFTVPVPAGWNVQGGLMRPNVLEWRPEVSVASPDGAVQVRIGDGAVQQFAVPYELPMIGALPQGVTPSFAGGEFSAYLPGAQFLLQYYLPRRIGQIGRMQAVDLPQIAQRAYQLAPPPEPMQGRADSGSVRFELGPQAQGFIGQFVATTRLLMPPPGLGGAGNWYLGDLFGYVCRPEYEALAQDVATRMMSGFQYEVNWYARQVQLDIGTAQQVISGNAELARVTAEGQQRYAAGMEAAQGTLTRGVAGLVDLRDDQGNVYRVPQTGSQNYYLVARTGEVLATDQADLPAYDFTQLYRGH
jgi:hypothetical protein